MIARERGWTGARETFWFQAACVGRDAARGPTLRGGLGKTWQLPSPG